MEGVKAGVTRLDSYDFYKKKNVIQVSNTKKPLFFYVNLAKRYLQSHSEVEITALGMAITTAVSVAEIVKNSGLGFQKKIATSTVVMKTGDKKVQKAKLEIVLGKTNNSERITAFEAAQRVAREKDKERNRAEAARNP